jgi:hypothetical protein
MSRVEATPPGTAGVPPASQGITCLPSARTNAPFSVERVARDKGGQDSRRAKPKSQQEQTEVAETEDFLHEFTNYHEFETKHHFPPFGLWRLASDSRLFYLLHSLRGPEHRRCEIFVEPAPNKFSSSSGAAYSEYEPPRRPKPFRQGPPLEFQISNLKYPG